MRTALSPLARGRSECRLRIVIFVSALLVSAGIARAAEIPLNQRRSDSDFVSADTRAMQNDDTANPAMLAVLDGEALWNTKAGATNKSCADCHGDAETSMKGVAARYPAFAADAWPPGRSRTADQPEPRHRPESRGAAVREQGLAGADGVHRAAIARHAGRGQGRCASRNRSSTPAAPSSSDARASSICPARSATTTIGAKSLPAIWCRRRMSDRLSDLSPGMAGGRLAAAAAAQLHERHARRALRFWRAGTGRSRIFPDVARPRHGDGIARGAAV